MQKNNLDITLGGMLTKKAFPLYIKLTKDQAKKQLREN